MQIAGAGAGSIHWTRMDRRAAIDAHVKSADEMRWMLSIKVFLYCTLLLLLLLLIVILPTRTEIGPSSES